MSNADYVMSSMDEYFEVLDKESQKRSQIVAKSLVKYLQKNKEATKFDSLKVAQK
ncbi:MAG: hypothetical protein R3Y28_00335 [Candidatus Gastranaerophilales bacterium]